MKMPTVIENESPPGGSGELLAPGP